MRVAIGILICCSVPAWAAAQSAAALPRNDVVVAAGWSGAEHERSRYAAWNGSLLAGATVGHYWTDHLKTEVEAGWSNPGEHEVYEDFERFGAFTYSLANYRARDLRVGVAQIYQFGRNAWAHPYVGIGFDVVRRDTTIDRVQQFRTVYPSPNQPVPIVIPAAHEEKQDVFGQATLKAGVKLYANERSFFATELKFGLRDDVDHVVWKIGLGFDF